MQDFLLIDRFYELFERFLESESGTDTHTLGINLMAGLTTNKLHYLALELGNQV